MVPNGWEVSFLKDVTLKIQDGNYGAEYPKKNELVNSGVPFLTSKVLGGDGRVNENKFDYITPDKHKKLKKAQITKDDILFTNRGANVGVIGLADEKLMDANIGPQLTLIRADRKQLESKFLYFALKGDYFQRQVNGQDSGSAMNFFGIKATEKFKVAIPPLTEQHKIAKILSTWDKAISTTEALIVTSKQQKKALMQQLLTGKKRLVDPETGEKFEGEWDEVPLDLLCRFTQGFQVDVEEQTSDAGIGSVRFIRIVDYTKDNEPPRYVKLKSNYYLIDEIDVVMVRYGDAGLACRGLKGVIANNMFLIAPKTEFLSKLFLYKILKFHYQKISSLAASSTMPALKFSDLKQFKIKLPNILEQHKITSVLNNADKEIDIFESKLAHLKQEKKALMQQLLTGKRRVKTDEEEAA